MDFSKLLGLASLGFGKKQTIPQETEVIQEEVNMPPPLEKPPIPEVEIEDVSAYRKHLLDKEGFENKAYIPTGKPNEPLTIGAGYTGPEITVDTEWTNEQVYENLDKGIRERLPILRATFPNFDDLPESVRVPMLGSWYRGGLGAWDNTQKLIAAGEFEKAADEVLNNKEYELAKTEEGRKLGMRGLVSRFEEFSEALREHGENVKGKATGGMVMRDPYSNYNKQRAI